MGACWPDSLVDYLADLEAWELGEEVEEEGEEVEVEVLLLVEEAEEGEVELVRPVRAREEGQAEPIWELEEAAERWGSG